MIEYTVNVFFDGSKKWFINGKRHREDGPAVEIANGTKCWHINGKLHREDGPAITFMNEDKELRCSFHLNGIEFNPIEYIESDLVSDEVAEDIVFNWIMYWEKT